MSPIATERCGGRITADELEELDVDEILSIIHCRLDELTRVGCDGPECLVLAGRVDVGIEQATDLVARGCPPELALRILL